MIEKYFKQLLPLYLNVSPPESLIRKYIIEWENTYFDEFYGELCDFIGENMKSEFLELGLTNSGVLEAVEFLYDRAIENGNIKE